MKTMILLFIFSLPALAQQSSYFFKQRAIMMAQLEYERNLDFMLIDPENCRVPLKKEDRIRVLKANITKLSKEGRFTHCRNIRFVGRRKILDNLRRQKASVKQIKTFDDPTGLIANNNGETNDSPIPNEIPETPVEDVETILEPIDDTVLPESGTDLSNYGTPPSNLPILSGYAGVPYNANAFSDETFQFVNNRKYHQNHYRSKNLPPGLTFAHTEGVIAGVPKTAGFYTPQIEVGFWGTFGATVMKFRGPVRMNILPTPKFTVLNPTQRKFDQWNGIHFSNGPAPFLNVKFLDSGMGVRTINGVKKGKYYFEAKVIEEGVQGTVGWDLGNSESGGGPAFGGKGRGIFGKKGDILMSAIDLDKRVIWFGKNGSWGSSGTYAVNPEIGLNPHVTSDRFETFFGLKNSSSPYKQIDQNTEFRPFVSGNKGTQVVMNFGDQPWEFEPPEGFSGIPYTTPSEPYANLWDSNTSTDYIQTYNLYGMGWKSLQFYTEGSGGDVMLALSPKSSGRWQFEMRSGSWEERTRMGIAPVNVDIKNLQKVGLGAAGTGSIGLRALDEAKSKTGKGVIEVDGKVTYIDRFNSETIITFDCNFDKDEVKIYANGSLIHTTELPGNKSGKWAIAATSASGSVQLITHPDQLKYPVKGAKAWVLDTSTCENCSTQKPVLEEEKGITCPAADFVLGGEEYSVEEYGANFPHCSIPETAANQIGACEIPGNVFACKDSSVGPKTHCPNDMNTYKTAELCAQECRSSPQRVKMFCAKRGDWTPSAR